MLIFYVEVAFFYYGCKSVMNHLPPDIVFSFVLFTNSAYFSAFIKSEVSILSVGVLGALSFVKQGYYVDFVCLIHV